MRIRTLSLLSLLLCFQMTLQQADDASQFGACATDQSLLHELVCHVQHHWLEVALALMGSVGIVAWWFFKKLRRWWNNGYEILTDETLRPALILPNNARAMEGDKVEYLTTDGDFIPMQIKLIGPDSCGGGVLVLETIAEDVGHQDSCVDDTGTQAGKVGTFYRTLEHVSTQQEVLGSRMGRIAEAGSVERLASSASDPERGVGVIDHAWIAADRTAPGVSTDPRSLRSSIRSAGSKASKK